MGLLVLACWVSPTLAQQVGGEPIPRIDVPDFLACGETVVRTLEAGAVHSYQFVLQEGEAFTLDAVDVDGSIELLRFRLVDPTGRGLGSTCTGRLPMRAPVDGVYLLEVRDCIGNDAGRYSLTMNVVSDTTHSCAEPVACAVDVPGALDVAGQVDSFAFYGAQNEPVSLDFSSNLEGRGGIEARVFDPQGVPVLRSCGGNFDFNLPTTGRYTVLVNACLGKNTGEYDLVLRSRSCPTHIGTHSGGGGVGLRLSTDGAQILQIAASSLSCAYNDSSGLVLDLNPPAAIVDGRFSVRSQTQDAAGRVIQMDGVFANPSRTQLLGGMSVLFGSARCNFQWAATSDDDEDWDGWSDDLERSLGSRPNRARSTPEDHLLPTTALFGPGVCRDRFDNDSDGAVDAGDDSCFGAHPGTPSAFPVFAGRHSGAGAFSVERSADGSRVTRLVATAVGCGAVEPRAVSFEVDLPIENNRFLARDVSIGGANALAGAQLSVDGVFFDGDDDGTREQALGGFVLRLGAECRYRWWASAHVDTDGDGWGDVAERRYGSDPRPMPSGQGIDSTPEDFGLPVTALNDVPTCSDRIDNDGNHFVDSADPKCPAATPTPSRTATNTSSPTRTPTQAATRTPTGTSPPPPTPSTTPSPTSTTTVVPTVAPTPSAVATFTVPAPPTDTPRSTLFPTRTATRTLPPTSTPTITATPTTAPCMATGAVKVTRSAPTVFQAGGVIEVTLTVDVNEASVPNGAVIVENLPPGWTLESATPPQSSANSASGELRWLFFGAELVDMTITYQARAPLALTPAQFCGSSLYNDANGVARCVVTPCETLKSQPAHPADVDADGRIGDDELLAWIDRWAAFDIGDNDLLDTIDLWAAPCSDGSLGCYCLDAAAGVGPRLFRPGECEA